MVTIIYAVLHFLVDLLCAFSMFSGYIRSENGYIWILLYNFFAFAVQLPIGIIFDYLKLRVDRERLSAGFSIAGIMLTAAGVFTNPVVLGLGNAFFHIGGGTHSIYEDHERGLKGKALGIFVAPGALGIYLGKAFRDAFNFYFFIIILLVAVVLTTLILCKLTKHNTTKADELCKPSNEDYFQIENTPSINKLTLNILIISVCFIIVFFRSYIGMALSFSWSGTIIASLLTIIAVVLGKIFGGFFISVLGKYRSFVLSLTVASVSLLLGNYIIFGLIGVFFLNVSMPITLYILVDRFRKYEGTFFGLLTLGLFAGFLPVFYGINFRGALLRILVTLAVSLFLTVCLELTIAIFYKTKDIYTVILIIVVNFVTNPITVFVNICAREYWDIQGVGFELMTEIPVFIIEAFVYYYFSKKKIISLKHPVQFAVIANTVSYAIGLIINVAT